MPKIPVFPPCKFDIQLVTNQGQPVCKVQVNPWVDARLRPGAILWGTRVFVKTDNVAKYKEVSVEVSVEVSFTSPGTDE